MTPTVAPLQPYAGTVYLLHLDRPLAGGCNQHGKPLAGHYLGWTMFPSVTRRVEMHRKGQSGCKYIKQAKREGIGLTLARTWQNVDRNFERKLKNRKAAGRLCPVCQPAQQGCA